MLEYLFMMFAAVIAMVLLVGLARAWSAWNNRPPLKADWTSEDLRFKDQELRVKADTDVRKDKIQTILGIAVLVTFAGTAATLIQGRHKMDADKLAADAKLETETYARWIADLGSDSQPRQTDAVNHLVQYWKTHPQEAKQEHIQLLITFVESNAKRMLKPGVPPNRPWVYSDFEPNVRTRPHIQAAMTALGELNRGNTAASPSNRLSIRDADLRDLSLQRLDFDNFDFSSCLLTSTDFTGCTFVNATAHSAWALSTLFTGATLDHVKFTGLIADRVTDFSGASVDGANFGGAVVRNGDQNELHELEVDRLPTGNFAVAPTWTWKVRPASTASRPSSGTQQ